MKNFFRVFLISVLALFLLPAAASAAEAVREPVILDFKEFAMQAQQQDWWDGLGRGRHDLIRYAGVTAYKESMTEAQQQAYADMRTWLSENACWNINKEASQLENIWYWHSIYLNADPASPWGLTYRPFFHDMDYCLMLDVTVPVAGWYRMELDLVKEAVNSEHYLINSHPGGGYADIAVNGEIVLDNYYFGGTGRYVQNLGMVYLNKGVNTITIYSPLGFNGGSGYEERCSYNLCSISFLPLDGIKLGLWATSVDLRNSYLPFDAQIDGTYSVVSSDPSTVTAEFDESGMLLLEGLAEKTAQLTVYKDGTALFTIPVSVSSDVAVSQNTLYYTLDGSKSCVLPYGQTAVGDLVCLTTQLSTITEEALRKEADIYFKSSCEDVVTVDQATGDVTAVGEGTANVTAYVLLDGVTKSVTATATVRDTTALAKLELSAMQEYLGTDNTVTVYAKGTKASGAKADLNRYALVWSVDDPSVASVSSTGRLTGLKPGTVNVTVTDTATGVSGSLSLQVIDNTQLPGGRFLIDLDHGKGVVLETGSLEEDGVALNRELTTAEINLGTPHGIFVYPCYPGTVIALDFILPKDGWYTVTAYGSTGTYGGAMDVFVDDLYMGIMDYNQGKAYSYNGPGYLNSVYLEAGRHTAKMVNIRSGQIYFCKLDFVPTVDCSDVELTLQAKNTVLVGETQELALDFTLPNGEAFNLKQLNAATGEYTNYYTLTSSKPSVLRVSGTTLTPLATGTATVTARGEIAGKAFTKTIDITVTDGRVLEAKLTAPKTTLKPTEQGVQLSVQAYGTNASAIAMPNNAKISYTCQSDIASVSSTGYVTITGKEGSAEVLATVTEGIRKIEAKCWITVTEGKTEPTIYTYEKRQTAKENISKYSWAATTKNQAVAMAEHFVKNFDYYYEAIAHEGLPRSARVGGNSDPNMYVCRYCKADLNAKYGAYGWKVDPVKKPWKITCPECKRDFPSNDFESFYKCGLDEQGRFSRDRAIANGGQKYLVNELYPEMGAGWGVDDGFGYNTGKLLSDGNKEIHYYIAYYQLCLFYPLSSHSGASYSILKGVEMLRDAYIFTGNEKYGNAGAILLDRLGDVYPDMNYYPYPQHSRGKITDYIWEGLYVQQVMATAADAFWDCFDNTEVVEYLRNRHVLKGISDPNAITPQTIRAHIDKNILLAIRDAIEGGQSHGNFGMSQAAMAYAAAALDTLPESQQMIDWVFRKGEVISINVSTGEQLWTGGDVMYTLVDLVNRNGYGNEGSVMYHRMWYQNLMLVADALNGYDRVQGADLWQNSKFLDLFLAPGKVTVAGNTTICTGEAGHVQGMYYYPEANYLLTMFMNTDASHPAHRQAARLIYASKEGNLSGLHGDIFTKNPESGLRDEIVRIVNEDGPWNVSKSDMLTGEGLSILRMGDEVCKDGVNNHTYSDYWMFFGLNEGSHGAWEALHIGIDAFGLDLTSGLGYPSVVNTYSAEREQWMRNTLSHNTVMVDDQCQLGYDKANFPLHFDDAGEVKVMDVSAPRAYAQTSVYRRTMVTVQLDDEVSYAVDFFHVLGGRSHTYSFHAHALDHPETQGLEFAHQPMGTYAGPEVPLGPWFPNPHSGEDVSANRTSGASWLDNVYRDSTPETSFSVDFAIEDYRNNLADSDGIHLKLTMLSEKPVAEVAIADGHPSNNSVNPPYIKYMLVRTEGGNDLESMFTSVIEPYRHDSQLIGSQLVQVKLLEGTEGLTDEAGAVKVTRADGREDYIVRATNADCLYAVCDEEGLEKFRFRGFVGVCSFENGQVIYTYGNEAVQVGEAIRDNLPAITGKVVGFTEGLASSYTMTVQLDQKIPAEALTDRYIYVNNDGVENGVYRIHGATVQGNTAELDLYTQTLVRKLAVPENLSKGYIHNIAVGQTFSIPTGITATPCTHMLTDSTYTKAENKTHICTFSCLECGTLVSQKQEACTDRNADGKCDRCGQVLTEKITIVGANMTLGNDLKMNFMVKKSDMQDGFVAKVKQGDLEPVELTLWDYNSMYYAASYSVAAKEMTDVLSCEIYDAQGTLVSNPFTRTIKQYAMTLLNNASQKASLKSVIVDMLNYGTEAQKYFHYNEDAYANADVTEAQQAEFATKDVTCANNQIKGDKFVGSNLSLEDSILLNVFFSATGTDGLTAKVSFTDYLGVEVDADAEVTQYNTSMVKVIVNQVVLADAKRPVTVTLYKGGAEIGSGVESVESYIARNISNASTGAINMAIMKFSTSAYNYLGGTN